MAKYSIHDAVLGVLADIGKATLNNIFSSKYSYTRIWRPLFGLEKSYKITRKTISTILWRLRKEGLVERVGAKKIATWQLTAAGKKHLSHSRAVPDIMKTHKKDGITRLVIFDIPERERKKRDIVRTELIICDFQQLQKSVWIGTNPLPESFIALLDNFQLADKVHIFSVREFGTLNKLK